MLNCFPYNKLFDQSFLAGCPVSITFFKHQQQLDDVYLRQLQRKKGHGSLCVLVRSSYEPKSNLSEAIATVSVTNIFPTEALIDLTMVCIYVTGNIATPFQLWSMATSVSATTLSSRT